MEELLWDSFVLEEEEGGLEGTVGSEDICDTAFP